MSDLSFYHLGVVVFWLNVTDGFINATLGLPWFAMGNLMMAAIIHLLNSKPINKDNQ